MKRPRRAGLTSVDAAYVVPDTPYSKIIVWVSVANIDRNARLLGVASHRE